VGPGGRGQPAGWGMMGAAFVGRHW
jgi:hypothetical protein